MTKHIYCPRQRQKFILLSIKALTFLDASRWVFCYQMKECCEQYCTRHNVAKLIWRYVTDLWISRKLGLHVDICFVLSCRFMWQKEVRVWIEISVLTSAQKVIFIYTFCQRSNQAHSMWVHDKVFNEGVYIYSFSTYLSTKFTHLPGMTRSSTSSCHIHGDGNIMP